MSLRKKQIDLDSLSLDGLEGLLDEIFGTRTGADAFVKCTDGGESYNSDRMAYSGPPVHCDALPETKLVRQNRKKIGGNAQTEQIANLSSQVIMLRARLQYALEQLEQARLTEASLRLSLAYTKDKLKILDVKNR